MSKLDEQKINHEKNSESPLENSKLVDSINSPTGVLSNSSNSTLEKLPLEELLEKSINAKSGDIYVAKTNEEIHSEFASESNDKTKDDLDYEKYVVEKLSDARHRLQSEQEKNDELISTKNSTLGTTELANTGANNNIDLDSNLDRRSNSNLENNSISDENLNLSNTQKSSDPYPPAAFLRSTPPMEKSAKILPPSRTATNISKYEPYYENYNGSYEEETINSSINEDAAVKARLDKASSKAYSKPAMATRTSRATRSAGLDLSDTFQSNKLKESVYRVREKHPFLMERPLTITDEDAYALLDKVTNVSRYRVSQLANELNSEEIKFIFHAIELLPKEDLDNLNALQQIAVIRASWSLYTIGWSTLQRNFPERRLQSTLELIYNSLVSDSSRADVRPAYLYRLIGDLVNLGKSDSAIVSDVVRNLNQSYNLSPDEGLETFISDYQILVESNFGGQILGDFFRKADLPILYLKKEILCQAMPHMHPAVASEVLSRVIADRDDLCEDKLYIYRQVADKFIHKQVNHPIWSYMSRELNRTYRRWYIHDRLNSHTQIYPAKSTFLETYTEDIEDLAMINQDIMAIRFENFILVDDRRRGDSIIYYHDDAVRDLLMRGLEEKDLANPKLAEIDASRAMQNLERSGVVLLNIIPPALEYSRRFMDHVLGNSRKNKHRRNIFNNWFRD